MSNFLLYTHILISQKINFVTEVRFSQKRSHIVLYIPPFTCGQIMISLKENMRLVIFIGETICNNLFTYLLSMYQWRLDIIEYVSSGL